MECSVCYAIKDIDDFEALVCGHTFCEDCLDQLKTQHHGHHGHYNSPNEWTIKCPTCRFVTTFTIQREEYKEETNQTSELERIIQQFKEQLRGLQLSCMVDVRVRYEPLNGSVNHTFLTLPPLPSLSLHSYSYTSTSEMDSDRSH